MMKIKTIKISSDIKPKQQEDESCNRLTKITHLNEDQDEFNDRR